MATVIYELIVKLGIDPKDLNEGQKKLLAALNKSRTEAGATARDIEASGKRAANFFTEIRNQALGLFATLVGGRGLLDFTRDATNGMASMYQQAQNLGTTVPELAALRNVVEANGGSADAAAQSFFNLSQAIQRAKILGPSKELQAFMGRIGASPNDSITAILQKYAAWSQTVPRQEAILFGQLGGLDIGTINELLKGAQQFNKEMQEAQARGLPSDETGKRLKDLQESYTGLSQAIYNVAREDLASYEPFLKRVADGATKWIADNKQISGTILEIGTAISSLSALKLAAGLFGFESFAAVLGTIIKRLTWLGALLTLDGDTPGADVPGGMGSPEMLKRNHDEAIQWNKDHPDRQVPIPPLSTRGAPGSGNGSYIQNRLVKARVPPEIARGIWAGIFAESGGDPNRVNPTSGAYGIMQVLGPRKAALFAKYGPHPNLDQQIDFLIAQLFGGDQGGASVLGSKSRFDAMRNFITQFERPAPGRETYGDLARGAAALRSMVSAAHGASYGAAAIAAGKAAVSGGNTTSTHIGEVHVHTQATDGRAAARDFRNALLVDSANQGLV
jgi:hypothetical protein